MATNRTGLWGLDVYDVSESWIHKDKAETYTEMPNGKYELCKPEFRA